MGHRVLSMHKHSSPPHPSAPAIAPRLRAAITDPRRAPVVQVDSALPAVAPSHLRADYLRQAFVAHPQGGEPEIFRERMWTDRPPAKAAVLVALVQRQEMHVLLTQRSAGLSNHSGQIAFPGGRQDPEDRNADDTALREAWEEVGLARDRVEVLGHLPEYTTGSGFDITPVIGLVQPPFALKPNPGEVDDIFEVPLSFLMNPAHHRRHRLEWDGNAREWFSMPYVERVQVEPRAGESPPSADTEVERFIWGATAGMLRNFYRFLAA